MTKSFFMFAHGFGGSDVLRGGSEEIPAESAPSAVRIKQHAVGVNFIDVLTRRGDLGGTAPFRLGLEAAGIVESVGSDVRGIAAGDRVVYAGGGAGSYADIRDVPADRVVVLPDAVTFEDAAAVFFKGLTADYLVNRLHLLSAGDWVLLHGAAGGLAALLVPLLRSQGIRTIGTVGSKDKVRTAKEFGCEVVLILGEDDIAAKVREATPNGVAVAYDPIGKSTFEASFTSLRRFGLLVSFGWASGDPDPIPLSRLRTQGSVFVTRPTVSHYTEDRADLLAGAQRVFDALNRGVYRARIDRVFPLREAAAAHDCLEHGINRGQLILEVTRNG